MPRAARLILWAARPELAALAFLAWLAWQAMRTPPVDPF